jgi:2-oxoisovalerate dehydrogenase E1 component
VARVSAEDSFVPLGDAANLVLVDEDQIERAARDLCQRVGSNDHSGQSSG